MNRRTAKACEACRIRKIRCNGNTPCGNCHDKPSSYIYRHRTRQRRPAAVTEGVSPATQATQPLSHSKYGEPTESKECSHTDEVYHSVSATQADPSRGHLQLYYGASSQFSFLQHIHRSILSEKQTNPITSSEVQDGGPGLDLFMQRGFFFGTRLSANVNSLPLDPLQEDEVSMDEAMSFLDHYASTLGHILPFINCSELQTHLPSLHRPFGTHKLRRQQMAILLAVLALGAATTEQQDNAERLFGRAKAYANEFDESVNLQAIQLSLILGMYHVCVGRPTSGYLHVGTACRKAFAMGLHKDIPNSIIAETPPFQQQCRITMWCLYFHECWQSLSLGRDCSIQKSDIRCPLPLDNPVICALADLASLMTQSAQIVYERPLKALPDMYEDAKSSLADLHQFAEQYSIASTRKGESSKDDIASVVLHNLYYHTILLTFRPFLIAKAARQAHIESKQGEGRTFVPGVTDDEMWLRQACRHAVDAAQDQISFLCNSTSEACKRLRYNCFFIESSCAVLFYDGLQHPYKLSHNLEYIRAGLKCMSEMIPGESVTSAMMSVQQILLIIERKALDLTRSSLQVMHREDSETISTRRDDHVTEPSRTDSTVIEYGVPTPSSVTAPTTHVRETSELLDHNFTNSDFNYDTFTTADLFTADLFTTDVFTTDLSHFFSAAPDEAEKAWQY
ncbi:fungal-specific transcription factor domain-containing protein [Leptodontidium sp. 2 PMI_412]|nr:fungal-specific transcription factor domain-containing protein [Leptodontidium sp. 2 PMI_412]